MEDKSFLEFLYIVDLFPPGGMQAGIRALEFSKRLVNKNIFPIILTKLIDLKKSFNINVISEIPSSLKIYRTNFFEFKNKFLLKLMDNFFRIDYYLGWVPIAYLKAKKILVKHNDIKFIYTSGPSFYTHILGYLLKKKFNIPLIVEYRDPWSLNPYEGKYHRWLNQKIDLLLEKKIHEFVKLIITVSPKLNLFLRKNFPRLKKKLIFSIANGMNIQPDYEIIKNRNQEIIFTYTGSLYSKRSIIPLLKIVSDLKKENFFKNFKFSLKIFGIYDKKLLKKAIKILEIENLIFLGSFIQRSDAIKEISKCNLAIHIGENLDYPTIAFKVWDYLSCRKKILYLGLENSYTSRFLKENEFGITIPIDNLNEGKNRLKNLLNDLICNTSKKYNIEQKLLEKFTWDYKTKEFIKYVIKNTF